MAKYELTMIVEVDEDQLAQHNGDLNPPPNDVKDWYVSDLFLAYEKGWIGTDWNNEELEFVKRLG